MAAPENIYSLLWSEEGERLMVYDDATREPIKPGTHVIGHPTIGAGIRLDVPILQKESDTMLANRVQALVARMMLRAWFRALDPTRRWAIISMAYTIGVEGVEAFTGMIAGLQAADWAAASAAILDSVWAKEQAPARAGRVAAMILSGQWPPGGR